MGSSRGARNGWITVRLQGGPNDVGYQHGRLLAPEIADALAVAKLNLTHDGKHDWEFYRKAAERSSGRAWTTSTGRRCTGSPTGARAPA